MLKKSPIPGITVNADPANPRYFHILMTGPGDVSGCSRCGEGGKQCCGFPLPLFPSPCWLEGSALG